MIANPSTCPKSSDSWDGTVVRSTLCKLLAKITARGQPKKKKVSPGQESLWEEWNRPNEEIRSVAEKFVKANEFPTDRPPKSPDPSPVRV